MARIAARARLEALVSGRGLDSDDEEDEEGEEKGEEWKPVEPMEGLEGGGAVGEGATPEDKYSELEQSRENPAHLRSAP